jgi:hypothetical protein
MVMLLVKKQASFLRLEMVWSPSFLGSPVIMHSENDTEAGSLCGCFTLEHSI